MTFLIAFAASFIASAVATYSVIKIRRNRLGKYTDEVIRRFEANELPIAYLTPESKYACEPCAKGLAHGKIEDYNSKIGFDWRGSWINPPDKIDEHGPNPFFVLFADGMTQPQIDAIGAFRELLEAQGATSEVSITVTDWIDDSALRFYRGESVITACEYCKGFAQTITAENQI